MMILGDYALTMSPRVKETSSFVQRPHLSVEPQLVAGKSHDFGPLVCPEQPSSPAKMTEITYGRQKHEAGLKYAQRLRRLDIFPASKLEDLQPIDRLILVEYMLDVLFYLNGCRKECAASMVGLPVPFRNEYLMAETIFSQKIPAHVFVVPQKLVTLRDRYGNRWRIKAREIDGAWYLLDGWAKFIADCSIDTMDVLGFTNSGPGLYDVNILGREGDTKKGVGYRMTDVEHSHESDNNIEGGSRKPQKRKRTVDHLSQGVLTKGSHSVKRMKPLDIHESDNNEKEFIIISSDEDSEYRSHDSYDETSENDFNGQTKRPKLKTRDVKAPVSRKRVDPLGKELFTIEGIPKPKHKYFVTRMQSKRRNELYIPKHILIDENLKIPRKIELVDIHGETYTSRKMVCEDGRTFYKGGWSRLGRKNHLRDNDLCICEFGEGDKYGFLFISFLRFIE